MELNTKYLDIINIFQYLGQYMDIGLEHSWGGINEKDEHVYVEDDGELLCTVTYKKDKYYVEYNEDKNQFDFDTSDAATVVKSIIAFHIDTLIDELVDSEFKKAFTKDDSGPTLEDCKKRASKFEHFLGFPGTVTSRIDYPKPNPSNPPRSK